MSYIIEINRTDRDISEINNIGKQVIYVIIKKTSYYIIYIQHFITQMTSIRVSKNENYVSKIKHVL